MKLATLIAQHEKFAAAGAPGCLGDGYLLAHNRVFARVREAVLALGFRLSSERNEGYESFPLLQLENLLRAKVLPYAPNAAAFAGLPPVQLAALDFEDLEGNLKKNFVLHESAHAIARGLAGIHLGVNRGGDGLEAQRRFVLRMLLEESCANVCELLGIIDLHDQVHRVLFTLNSYMGDFANRTHLKNAVEAIGFDVVSKFMLLAYLHANFLRERIEDADFPKIVALASGAALDLKRLKTLRALSKIAFQLNERFRVQTTGFHLRLAGIQTPLKELLNFDFISELRGPEFAAFLNAWTETLSIDSE